MASRRSLKFPITLGIVMIVLVVVLTVGWVLAYVFLAWKENASIYYALLAVGATFLGFSAGRHHHLSRAHDQSHQSQPAAVELHRQRDPRAQDAHRIDEALLADARPPAGERRGARGFYGCMVDDLDRLDRLINQLLDAGRLEDGRIDADREDVALDPLLRDCAATVSLHYRLPAEIFQIELQPCTIRAWRVDLDVLFRNLIDNAVKYAGSEPRVGVHLRRTDDGLAIVRISDNGRGIPGRFRRHIFKRFERLGLELERERPARAWALHRAEYRPTARARVRVRDNEKWPRHGV